MQKRKKKKHKALTKELPRGGIFRTCYVCDRESTELLMIGPTRYRHDECCPGSYNWLEWYAQAPASEHSDAGDYLYHWYMKGEL